MIKKTMTEKLLKVLSNGKEITPEKLANKTGLANVGSTISRLKAQGYRIYTNPKTINGAKKNVYRMAA